MAAPVKAEGAPKTAVAQVAQAGPAAPKPAAPVESGEPTVTVTDTVIVKAPSRLGTNIIKDAYYGDRQIVSKPIAHGGFHKGRQVSFIQVKDATADTVTTAFFDPATGKGGYPESFAGGTYCIGAGARRGEQGAIVAHDAGSGVFRLEHAGAPLEDGDLVWLRGPWTSHAAPMPARSEPGLGIGQFRLAAENGAEVDLVDSKTDPLDQYVRVRFSESARGGAGGVKYYFGPLPNDTYRVRVRARASEPGSSLEVEMRNLAFPNKSAGNRVEMTCAEGDSVGTEWKDYVFEGRTPDNPAIRDKFSAVIVILSRGKAPSGVEGYIDSVELEDEAIRSDCAFSQRMIDTIKEARCGQLRFIGAAEEGSLVDDITARSSTESGWTFVSYGDGYVPYLTHAVMDDWMKFAIEAGAAPYMTVPGANTPDDYYNLISYLAAPADFDEYSRRRAAHGYKEPWTARLDRIYLEIGNEWWNGIFKPFYIARPAKYGEMCAGIIARMRENPHFDPAKFVVSCGGWAVNAQDWNAKVDAACQGHAIISVAPYVLRKLDQYDSTEDRYGALFADVDSYAILCGQPTFDALKRNGKGTRLACYELNTHLVGGQAPATVASEICTSVAAGVAVLDQAMSYMSRFGANPINFFSYLGRGYGKPGDERLGLWGNVIITPEGLHRPRPVWLSLEMANQHLIAGDMVAVQATGIPTWNQPENACVTAMPATPYIHAYAFLTADNSGRRQVNLLLINRHRTDPLAVRVQLPFTPADTAKCVTLTSANLADNNEESEVVKLKEGVQEGLSSGKPVRLPPFSAVTLQIVEAEVKSPRR